MSFNRALQGKYRPLVSAAWKLHCSRLSVDESDKLARDKWTRAELQKSTGKTSTKDCDQGRHFERAMSHFEALAEDGIHWQLSRQNGDAKRLRWHAGNNNPDWLKQFATEAAFETYLRGIASRITSRDNPQLHDLNDAEIGTLTRAVIIDAKRSLTRAQNA